jgi:hypothetical protein
MSTELCLSWSASFRALMPARRPQVVNVRRTSCQQTAGSPKRAAVGLMCRATALCKSIGVFFRVPNNKSSEPNPPFGLNRHACRDQIARGHGPASASDPRGPKIEIDEIRVQVEADEVFHVTKGRGTSWDSGYVLGPARRSDAPTARRASPNVRDSRLRVRRRNMILSSLVGGKLRNYRPTWCGCTIRRSDRETVGHWPSSRPPLTRS